MPTYEQVAGAGDGAAQNVYKLRFDTNDCSDMPQLQAWDDYTMTTVASESLSGTEANAGESLVAAAHTTNAATPASWPPANGANGGGTTIVGAQVRANRLRGATQYLLLGDPGDAAPLAGEERKFQLAFGCADDSAVGTGGHLPVLAAKVFYAGAPPVLSWFYNSGTPGLGGSDGSPQWVQMVSGVKGTPMSMSVKNTIHATGPGSSALALDPVTKPGSGEKWAEAQWVMTAL